MRTAEVGRAAAPPKAAGRVRFHGLITLSVMAATIMQALDTTIANVALPRMQGTLSATQDEMGWVLTSYIVAAAITIPLTGWLAGQFGRRRVFLISIFIFTVASALCGLAVSLPQIVLFRFLQGVGGAALVPLSQAVLFDINPPKDFGRAMAIWGIGVTMGPILGPALGGWLTENYTWRWVFYINLPIGILAFVGLYFTLPENRNAQGSRFDFFGFISLSVFITALQLMLDRGQLLDWFSSREITTEAIVAGVALYLFLVHTFSYAKPFLNPHLFQDRNFVASNIFIFVVGVVLFATLALVPPLLQNQMQYPVVLTGLVTAPRGAGTMIAMIVVGRLVIAFRCALHHRHRAGADRLFAVADDAILAADEQLADHHLRHPAGLRRRPGLGAAIGGRLHHPAGSPAQRRHVVLQPAAQCRQLHRHFGGVFSSHPEHAETACLDRRAYHAL